MYKIKNTTVFNDDKVIKRFDTPEDAQNFVNAVNYLDQMEEYNENIKINNKQQIITSIKEFKRIHNL